MSWNGDDYKVIARPESFENMWFSMSEDDIDSFKAKSRGGQIDSVAKSFQECIRLEACDESGFGFCVTCGSRHHYKKANAGHFIPRLTRALVFNEKNVHFQCVGCNKFKSGNIGAYRVFMVNEYGEELVEEFELIHKKKIIVKYTMEELAALRSQYRRRAREARKKLRK